MKSSILPTWWKILERDWRRNRKALSVITFAWIFVFFAFPLVQSSTEEMLLGGFVAIFIGYRLGSSDSMDGAEEFALILPPRRTDYLCSRFLAGAVLVCAFVLSAWIMGVLVQLFWSIFVESGLTESVGHEPNGWNWQGQETWNLIARIGTVIGLFSCVFVSVHGFGTRLAMIGIPLGLLLCMSFGLLGVALGQKLPESLAASQSEHSFRRASWTVACFVGVGSAFLLGLFDSKSRQYSDARSLRALVIVLAALMWMAVYFLVTALDGTVELFLPTGPLWEARWSVVLAITLLTGGSVFLSQVRWRASSTREFRERSMLSRSRVAVRLLSVASFVWLFVTHWQAVRAGYQYETATTNRTVQWPAANHAATVNAVIYATPIFDPNTVIAATPFSIRPGAQGAAPHDTRSVQLMVINGDTVPIAVDARWEFNVLHRLFLSCDSSGDYTGAPFWIKSENGLTDRLETAAPFTGEDGQGYIGPTRNSLGLWGMKEQGLSMPYRLWCAAFVVPDDSNEPVSISIADLITRARAAGIVEADPLRLFENGTGGGKFHGLRYPSGWESMNFVFVGTDQYPIQLPELFLSPNELIRYFRWPSIIGLGSVALIAMGQRRWRKRCFLGLVVVFIGYLAVLDRLSVSHSMGVIRSDASTIQAKAEAATKLSRTVFWKQTARRILKQAVGKEPDGIGRFYREVHDDIIIRRRNE
ncbi:MAG: ABC-2 transporter permease [Verrucomicrobiae bacterium]|nr:ABC-2 transporter permease [Verrucomicrobiae bacterium]